MSELDALTQELAQLRDLFQRRLLDDRAKNQLIESVQASLAARDALDTSAVFSDVILEVLVALDRLVSEEASPELNRSVHDEIVEVYARRGLQHIATDGPFDPALHHATGKVAASPEHPARHIAQVEREGYTLGERVLRPARVVVATD